MSPDLGPARHTKWRRPLWIAAAIGTVIAGAVVLAAGQRATSPSTDVVLDEPGEYQQPGIATNAPLQGARLRHGEIFDLDGETISTAQWFEGNSPPMLVNFWFTTCPPCRREMPALEEAFSEFGSKVRFIGVNVQDSASTIESFTEELDVTYEMVRDPNGTMVAANGIAAFPTTLFIDSNGRIVKQVAGELSAEMIEQAISELLESSDA